MPKVFVSYARADQEMVQALIRELQELGYDAFYDQNLTGGQRWWDVLLDQVQSADGFLPVLTSEYRQSEACHREAVWAESLGIPFVPIDLGQASPDLFEKVVAEANWVRYSLDDRASVARLARALGAMPKPELPSPLPPRPAIPISYFAELEREIRTTPTIPLERQFAIIATLRAKLYTREDASARIMLGELRNRTDITYSNAVDIERMLASPVQQQTAAQPQQQPQPNPQTEPRHHQRAPEPPPTQHATAPQPPAYQQGTQQPPPVYAPSNFQQAAPHPAAHPGYVHPPQPSERSASGASFSTVVRYGLVGIGALFVLLALFGLDYVSFKQPNGTAPAESFGQMGDLVTRSDVSGVPGLSKVFFEWLGYILLIGLLVTAVLCVLLRRVPRALLVTCLCVAGLAMLFTIVSVVLLANRSKAQGYPVGYEVGFWFTIIAVVMLAIAAVIPHRRATAAPWRPAAPAMR